MNLPIEEIPNKDYLYYRIHKSWTPNGELIPGVFRDRNGGMSTDWNKYSSPEETQLRSKTPSDNGVISLHVGGVREIEGLSVIHSPDHGDPTENRPPNRAHTDVLGNKKGGDPQARVFLRRLSTWAIKIS